MPGHLETARAQRAKWEDANLNSGLLGQLERDYALPRGVLAALAYKETGGQPKPTNPFQMQANFVKEYGIRDTKDPESLAEALYTLREKAQQRYGDENDLVNALIMYNVGPQSADKVIGGDPAYATKYPDMGRGYANGVLDALKGRAIHYETPDRKTDRLFSLKPGQTMLGMRKGGLIQMKNGGLVHNDNDFSMPGHF